MMPFVEFSVVRESRGKIVAVSSSGPHTLYTMKEPNTKHIAALRELAKQHEYGLTPILEDLLEGGYAEERRGAYCITGKGRRYLESLKKKRTYPVLGEGLIAAAQHLAGSDLTVDQRAACALHASRVLFKRVKGVRTRQGRTMCFLMARGAMVQAEFGSFYKNAGEFPQTDLSHFDAHQGKLMRRGAAHTLGYRYDPGSQGVREPSVQELDDLLAENGLRTDSQRTLAVWMGLTMREICTVVPATELSQFHGDVERAMEEPGLTEQEAADLAQWLVVLREVRS